MSAVETPAVRFDIEGLAVFAPEQPSFRILLDSAASRLILISLCANQWLPEQTISSATLVQVIRGRIRFRSGPSQQELGPGALLQVDRRVPFVLGSLADQPESIVLLTITPRPDVHMPESILAGILPLVTESAPPVQRATNPLLPVRRRRRSVDSPLNHTDLLPGSGDTAESFVLSGQRGKSLPMLRPPHYGPSSAVDTQDPSRSQPAPSVSPSPRITPE